MFGRHLSIEILADLNEERLADAERAEARVHVDACARCAAELVWLECATQALRANDLEDAPNALVMRAVRLFPAQPATRPVTRDEPGRLRRLVATLTFDSGTAPLALGMRSALPSERQLLLSVGEIDIDIDLRVTPEGGRWLLAGQVLGTSSPADATVALRSQTDPAIAEAVSAFGEFAFAGVPSGVYEFALRLEDAHTEIVVPDLRIGA